MKRVLVSATSVFIAACFTSACSKEEGGLVGPEGVIYEGTATDEAIVPLLAAKAVPSTSLQFTAPLAGEAVAATAPMTFSWSAGLAAVAPSSSIPLGSVAATAATPRRTRRWTSVLGIRAAHAHPNPFNGQGYYLRVEASGTDILRVFTSLRSHLVGAEDWKKLVAAGGQLRATLVSAVFEKNRIITEGGPFEAPAVTFRITP